MLCAAPQEIWPAALLLADAIDCQTPLFPNPLLEGHPGHVTWIETDYDTHTGELQAALERLGATNAFRAGIASARTAGAGSEVALPARGSLASERMVRRLPRRTALDPADLRIIIHTLASI